MATWGCHPGKCAGTTARSRTKKEIQQRCNHDTYSREELRPPRMTPAHHLVQGSMPSTISATSSVVDQREDHIQRQAI
eukprot:CAMPEP_0175474830 /NCGR_PEP_ID=MMETSP0095-20121207/75096_1 /TAXON_ID=311494 /ORGANISM="Alexandrium monilatum, Strain CCMP3105" /LENGTH=77 /DNA_ID=CAMNT_0016776363 /DNA_START=94 /DNA_END=327 /DNA_ORIENTATION=+